MATSSVYTHAQNLTEFEQLAIDAETNLSDGHPRQHLTSGQMMIVDRFPDIFAETRGQNFQELEMRSQQAFLNSLGQLSAPVLQRRVFSVYSSSVTTMVVSKFLRSHNRKVALLHPTFDNIPDILKDDVEVRPVTEEELDCGNFDSILASDATCVFVTTPNNPTGWPLREAAFRRLVALAQAQDLLLCFDTSFRGFDTRTQFDGYRILEESGVDYLVIEDTGKLWPTAELKLSFIATSESNRKDIEHELSDVLLSVSPFVLGVVEALAHDSARDGYSSLHQLIADNRGEVIKAVADLPEVHMPDTDSRISVCRLLFESAGLAAQVHAELRDMNVHVLPCRQFHWNSPDEGAAYLRVALARDTELLTEALKRLSDIVRASR